MAIGIQQWHDVPVEFVDVLRDERIFVVSGNQLERNRIRKAYSL